MTYILADLDIDTMPPGPSMDTLIAEHVGIPVEEYSTSIAHAERLALCFKEPYSWSMESVNLEGGGLLWDVVLWGDVEDDDIFAVRAKAERLSLALCRAVLKFVIRRTPPKIVL